MAKQLLSQAVATLAGTVQGHLLAMANTVMGMGELEEC